MVTKLEQELQLQVAELKKALNGNHEHSWYQQQINERDKRIQELFDSVKAHEEIESNKKIEAQVIANDAIVEQETKLREYNQSEHTRFRLTDTPIKLDIFGSPDTPVFDCGVNFSMYDGPVYLPVAVVIEMAQSIGMQTEEQVSELQVKLADAENKNVKAAQLATELIDGFQSRANEFADSIGSVAVDSIVSDNEQSEADSGNAIDLAKIGGQASGDNSDENSDGIPDGTGNELNADSIPDESDGTFDFPK